MTKQYDICLLPGDGIGPEIIAEGVKVLNAVGAKYDTRFDCKESLIGGAAIDAVGDPLPAATLDDIKAAKTIRFRYSYKDGQTVDLPLNDADLAYWKGQVE